MDESQTKLLSAFYSTPPAAWRPHLARLSRHLGQMSPRWDEQIQQYEQPPAPISEFITSPLYLNLQDQVYPGVLQTVQAIFGDNYNEAVLCWGIGAGKSFLSSISIAYMLHRTLCLRDPQAHFGLAPGSTIAFMNMAPSAQQAQRVVFSEIRNRIRSSPWFHSDFARCEALKTELRFPKNIVVVPGCSAETFPLGYNILGAVVDEAAWFVETEEGKDYAEEIYNALQRRIRSRFLDRGLLILISSPRHTEDFIETKLREAESNPKIYASRRPVWEVKPGHIYCGETFDFQGMKIPVEYQADFERNSQRALRDIAARPTDALEAFFTDPQVIELACDATIRPALDDSGRWQADFHAPDRLPRYVHIDLGLTRDACGLAMAHCQPAPDNPDEPTAIVDLAWRLSAPEGGEVDLSRVRQLVVDMRRRGFNIAQVSYDGFQSVDSRQILQRQGFRTKLVSVDRDLAAYETLKELINTGRLRIPDYEPLKRELRSLEIIRGRKVDHPPRGSKDVADAVAGAVSESVRAWGGGEITGHVV